jgi:ABC-2 type transport system ATP-binding protein
MIIMSDPSIIHVSHLSKNYGETNVLNNVSFDIMKGEIVGFLGTNGAGKTTLMRILTTYLQADKGNVLIDRLDVQKDYLMVRRKIGYLSEVPALYNNMSVDAYLRFACRLKDVLPKRETWEVDRVMAECNLKDVQHKTIGILSKGFRQRIGIAQALINEPPILILDEPTSGLDPIQIIQVRHLIKNCAGKQTVLLSTHILSEIEEMAERVLILKDGRIAFDHRLDSLPQGQHKTLEKAFLKLHTGEVE